MRLAEPTDADDIVRLALEVQAHHVAGRPDVFRPGGGETAAEVADRITSGGDLYWLATLGDRIVGYAHARMAEEPESRWKWAARVCRLEQMGVSVEHRRHGAGRALWEAVRRGALERGADRIVLNVWAFNDAARRFYERMGLTPFNQRLAVELRATPCEPEA